MVEIEVKVPDRLDCAMASELPDWSRAQIKRAIEAGQVCVNGALCVRAGQKLKAGDCVTWEPPERVDMAHPKGEAGIAFSVLYADGDLIVIDKPAGVVVHPGAGHVHGTLVNGLLSLYPELADVGESERPGIVHRLDAETSGLLLVARSSRAYHVLVGMFSRHEVHRQYWAICQAPKLADAGRFDTPFGRHPTQRIKFTSRFEAEKRAITDYRVIERGTHGMALVTCLLETGRTHQVRVHLSEHQAPILGDPLYAPAGLSHHKAIGRLALHAGKLAFLHPISGEPCTFVSPFPEDFREALGRFGLHVPEI